MGVLEKGEIPRSLFSKFIFLSEGIDHKKNLLRFGTLLFFVYFVLFVVFKDVDKDKFSKRGLRGIMLFFTVSLF